MTRLLIAAGLVGTVMVASLVDGAIVFAQGSAIDLASPLEGSEAAWFWDWIGWPTFTALSIVGSYWAYRRAHSSLLSAILRKAMSDDGEEQPADRSPFVESPSGYGSLLSGALLLAYMTLLVLSHLSMIGFPSDLKIPSEAMDFIPWVELMPWIWLLIAALMVGLFSESRGVGLIPIAGYVLGMVVWHASPGQDMGDLTGNLSDPVFLLTRFGVPAILMYLAFRQGRVFRGMFV